MNIIAVDDERPALFALRQAIEDASPTAHISCFDAASEALAYARAHQVDVAFLDIEMDEMNGLELAKALKDIRGDANIIFVTGYNRYSVGAFTLHASGYVLKPINPQRIAVELENLRFPVQAQATGTHIRCFGNFDVFADGLPIAFGRPKAKEMLAYLVDRRGASVSKRELASVLFESEAYTRSVQSHLHILLSDMTQALAEAGMQGLVVRRRGQYAVDMRHIPCDYYRYLDGDVAAVNSYRGEYMVQYSWAEFTAGGLANRN